MNDWVMVPHDDLEKLAKLTTFNTSALAAHINSWAKNLLAAAPQQQADPGHSCSYYCTRPECIKAQRDELRDRMEAQQQTEPVAYVIRSMRDGSISDEIAPVGWRTFDYKMAKLREEPWVKNGISEIVPLYASAPPRITAAQVEQIKRLASLYGAQRAAVVLLPENDEEMLELNHQASETLSNLHAALDALVKE